MWLRPRSALSGPGNYARPMSIFSRSSKSALVASAVSVNPGDVALVAKINAARQKWQAEAWPIFDQLAEVHYPTAYTGSALQRFSYLPGIRSSDNPLDPARVPDPSERTELDRVMQDLLWALDGPQGDINDLARLYAMNDAVAGEGYLTGEDVAGYTNWEYLSVKELVPAADDGTGKAVWSRSGLGTGTPDDGRINYSPHVKRFWNAHPARTFMADAPLLSLGDDAARLIALNASMTSRILNRMAQSGILFIPSGLTVVGANEAPDGSTDPVKSPFWLKFLDTIEAAILQRNTAAGAIPIILQGNAVDGEAIRHIVMDRTIDRVEMELRSELRSNLAMGQDLPPESQTGMGGSNHWNVWAIGDDAYQGHLLPKAQTFARNVTREFVWPGLRLWVKENGKTGPEFSEAEIRRRVVIPDGSHVITRPNASEDARQLRDRLTVSNAYLNAKSGATPEDAPSEEEYVRQFGVLTNNWYLATFGLDVQGKIDGDKANNTTNGVGAPGVGGTPPSRRPADSSMPSGAPGGNKGSKKASDETIDAFTDALDRHALGATRLVGEILRGEARGDAASASALQTDRTVFRESDLDGLGVGSDFVAAHLVGALRPVFADLVGQGFDAHEVAGFVEAAATWMSEHREHPLVPLSSLRHIAESVLNTPNV
jgi:hypothetical protein